MVRENFLVVTAARNEAEFLGKTINSLISQTVLPVEWVIVDDGSVDETGAIAAAAARSYPWIKVVRREDRGYRDVGAGQAGAIHYGLQHLSADNFEFIFNIDADVILPPGYFETILDKFTHNPRLGIAGGQLYEFYPDKLVKMRVLPLGMIGAVQGWRRKCFQEIGGLAKGPGWDGIASFQAMMLGWQSLTFADKALQVIHLRPEGTSIQNRYHGWVRHGRALHFLGAHPLWVIASAAYHMVDRPYVLGGVCLILGYLDALANRAEQYDAPGFKLYLQDWQMKKLARILRLR